MIRKIRKEIVVTVQVIIDDVDEDTLYDVLDSKAYDEIAKMPAPSDLVIKWSYTQNGMMIFDEKNRQYSTVYEVRYQVL